MDVIYPKRSATKFIRSLNLTLTNEFGALLILPNWACLLFIMLFLSSVMLGILLLQTPSLLLDRNGWVDPISEILNQLFCFRISDIIEVRMGQDLNG